MIRITLNQQDARLNGFFFNNITEACNRGCSLTWTDDYSKAILELDTSVFLTKEDITNIINYGGEVDGLVSYIEIDKETFETGLVPESIIQIAFPNSEEKMETVWKALFNVYEETDNNKVKVALSPCSVLEPLPMSIVLSEFGEDFNF